MLFLKIYIGFSILTFVLLLMHVYVMCEELKREQPDIAKNNKSGILEKVFVYVKAFITCFVPIVNIGMFYTVLFETEKLKEKTLKKYKESRVTWKN